MFPYLAGCKCMEYNCCLFSNIQFLDGNTKNSNKKPTILNQNMLSRVKHIIKYILYFEQHNEIWNFEVLGTMQQNLKYLVFPSK